MDRSYYYGVCEIYLFGEVKVLGGVIADFFLKNLYPNLAKYG